MHSTLMTLHNLSQACKFLANGLSQNLILYGSTFQHAISHADCHAARGHLKGLHAYETFRHERTAQVRDGNLMPNAVRGIAKREATSA